MKKTPLIIATLLALSGTAVFAQTSSVQTGGTTGAAPTKGVGSTANVKDTGNGTTTSTSMEEQRQKKANSQGVPSTTYSNTK